MLASHIAGTQLLDRSIGLCELPGVESAISFNHSSPFRTGSKVWPAILCATPMHSAAAPLQVRSRTRSPPLAWRKYASSPAAACAGQSARASMPITLDKLSRTGKVCLAYADCRVHLTGRDGFPRFADRECHCWLVPAVPRDRSQQGAVAKWLRQRIANPPSSVQLRPAPLDRNTSRSVGFLALRLLSF